MENATKALMMAASILITILILGLLVFTFRNIKETQDEDRDSILTEQVTQFNKRFTAYEKEIRGNELYSLINRMIDYNQLIDDNAGTNKATSHDKMEIKITMSSASRSKSFNFNNIFNQNTYDLNWFAQKKYTVATTEKADLRQTVEAIETKQENVELYGGQNKLQSIVSKFDTYATPDGTGFQAGKEEDFREALKNNLRFYR